MMTPSQGDTVGVCLTCFQTSLFRSTQTTEQSSFHVIKTKHKTQTSLGSKSTNTGAK